MDVLESSEWESIAGKISLGDSDMPAPPQGYRSIFPQFNNNVSKIEGSPQHLIVDWHNKKKC